MTRHRPAVLFGLLVLAAWSAVALVDAWLFRSQVGFDFYQFWGIALAHAQLPGGNPYASPEPYASVLNAMGAGSPSARLHMMNGFRPSLQPLGTPFFYPWFAVLPRSYDAALGVFGVLQHVAVAGAALLLWRARRLTVASALLAAALAELTFNPFVQDVKLGNVNSLQLLAMAAMVCTSVANLERRSVPLDFALGALAVALVAFKPNTPWIALALAVHVTAARGLRGLGGVAAGGGIAGLAALALGAAYFGGWNAWTDWLAYARRIEGGGTLSEGNLSLALMVAHGPGAQRMVQGVCLVLALFAAAAFAVASAMGSRRDAVMPALCKAARDPGFAISCAVVLTFATYPLVWAHYHVWALLPMLWLVRAPAKWNGTTLAIIFSYAAFSRPVLQLCAAVDATQVLALLVTFAWLPLVAALLLELRDKRDEAISPTEAIAQPVGGVPSGR